MIDQYIEHILKAKVYDVARETPLDHARSLSKRLDNHIYLKREDLQAVFSFKLRGAYNKIASLTSNQIKHGIIAASAGNHAQGVALSAHKLSIPALVIMPKTTPEVKIKAVKFWGAEVILHGDSYDDALNFALGEAKQKQMTFIHAYDDLEVIAGQGTIAMELIRQMNSHCKAVFVPVGGGGLIAGIAVYLKFVRPEIKIIGVEPEDADSLNQALKYRKRIKLDQVGLFADGVAVKQIGLRPFQLALSYVDQVITVNTDEICSAIKDIFEDTRSVAEPAGALALAGLKKYIEQTACQQEHLVAIQSGANMNFDRLRYVTERTSVGEQSEFLLAVTIPEKPGSFLKFCRTLGRRNITEFNYRYAHHQTAHVFVGISCQELNKEKSDLITDLGKQNFSVIDMTHNELAKDHIRHMVGGHSEVSIEEIVLSFEFPERPGALLNFLETLDCEWNISLFHYRNHGAAFGKVLLGLQMDTKQISQLEAKKKKLGYKYQQETNNPAYRLFAGQSQ